MELKVYINKSLLDIKIFSFILMAIHVQFGTMFMLNFKNSIHLYLIINRMRCFKLVKVKFIMGGWMGLID